MLRRPRPLPALLATSTNNIHTHPPRTLSRAELSGADTDTDAQRRPGTPGRTRGWPGPPPPTRPDEGGVAGRGEPPMAGGTRRAGTAARVYAAPTVGAPWRCRNGPATSRERGGRATGACSPSQHTNTHHTTSHTLPLWDCIRYQILSLYQIVG